MNKLFYKVMDIEFLAKYLMAWGVAINVLIVAWILGKIIIAIASL